ncbi:MAG: riboflavin synthase [Armatimonadetes bacterium]|nr:riboflavin synthase [Armatimonadota bacterium]
MFTGIIQHVVPVLSFENFRLIIQAPEGISDWQIGESIAINGCCLTLVGFKNGLEFDLSEETLRRTAFGGLHAGQRMNLERAMKVGERFGGHYVQGHVDGVGKFLGSAAFEGSHEFRFQIPEEGARYVIDKGSISINGISLTAVEPLENTLSIWIIPHTLQETNLGDLKPGDPVNLEYDVMARYAEKILTYRA